MCGIVGYVGEQPASAILLDGLKRLEYRGYDSSGLAVFDNGGIECHKAVGNIHALETRSRTHRLRGSRAARDGGDARACRVRHLLRSA